MRALILVDLLMRRYLFRSPIYSLNMVIIKELEVKNCLGVRHVMLKFEQNFYATIFNCIFTNKNKNVIVEAIKTLFFENYEMVKVGSSKNLNNFIRIKFLIRMNKRNGYDVVDVKRCCGKPGVVFYNINGSDYKEPVDVFYEHFHLNLSRFFPFMNKFYIVECKNLMHSWVSDMCQKKVSFNKSFELFADYIAKIPINDDHRRLTKLVKLNLFIDKECYIMQKKTFFDVANEINTIFTFITFNEYNVQFIIPFMGKNYNVFELQWEHIDLENVETRVMKKGWQTTCGWVELELGLKGLLKISEMIALAVYLDQKLIILDDSTSILEYQNREMIKETYMQKTQIHMTADWNTKNFVQRIVDICDEKEIMIFMNCYVGLPFTPSNTNIINCNDSTEDEQMFFINTTSKNMDLDNFFELMTKYIAPNTV